MNSRASLILLAVMFATSAITITLMNDLCRTQLKLFLYLDLFFVFLQASSGAVEHLKCVNNTYGMFGRLRDFSATNSSLIELSRSTKCIQLLKGTEQQHRSKFEAKSFA
ncbi:hypothetical protein RB195_002596 [Necator americanus]|uniref:Uncharacterized protein n=1 Tax=Necator americanus TaxID=51031 RepID=A0ABR1DML9_NECAM